MSRTLIERLRKPVVEKHYKMPGDVVQQLLDTMQEAADVIEAQERQIDTLRQKLGEKTPNGT